MAEEGEDEVLREIEALQSVYGDDCLVIRSVPPHIHLHIKPRTADISFQQFVEAVIEIHAGSQYPDEPPHISLVEFKGLDEERQNCLVHNIRDKACELSSCSMLVTLCEAAVEKLTSMNHPDGDCPLCLYPLASEDEQQGTFPFMKLMSCFHCFHSDCISRWWNWSQIEKDAVLRNTSTAAVERIRFAGHQNDKSMGNCPVCRKVFHTKDMDHVLDLVGSSSAQLSSDEHQVSDGEDILHSTMENIRREKFEAILKVQQAKSGLIEPKKDLVVLPGMFLSQPNSTGSQLSKQQEEEEAIEQLQRDSSASNTHRQIGNRGHVNAGPPHSRHRRQGGESTKPKQQRDQAATASIQPNSSGSCNNNRPAVKNENFHRRKPRVGNEIRQVRQQWAKRK